MKLAGQGLREERGYAMVALLVGLSVMAVMMTVAMPVWKQASTREREAELVFRGEQYARAIGLFQRKFANAAPPSIDVLVQQRFLRKKYKDPITNDDFVPILQGQNAPGALPAGGRGSAAPGGQTTPGGQTPPGGQPSAAPSMSTPQPLGGSPGGSALGAGGTQLGVSGGLMGVTSKSKDKSIRLYKGRSHYNEWQFTYTQPTAAPGAGAQGAPGTPPGQRGQGQRPGGPGQSQPQGTTPFGQRGGRGGR